MSVPVGLSIPKLLPITGTFVAPFSAYYIWLQTRVVLNRVSCEEFKDNKSGDNAILAPAIRAQSNFSENVPLALALAAVVELNGGSRKVLANALSLLFVLRVLHAEIGIMAKDSTGVGRPAGYFGTQAVLLGLGSYAAYLVKDYWFL